MGIFGGEKYSKEGYEQAKKDKDAKQRNYSHIGSLAGIGLSTEQKQGIYNELAKSADRAREKLAKLYAKGQTEAITLNEEYDRLLARAQEAIQAVADFEREKLGMHKEGAEKVDAEK